MAKKERKQDLRFVNSNYYTSIRKSVIACSYSCAITVHCFGTVIQLRQTLYATWCVGKVDFPPVSQATPLSAYSASALGKGSGEVTVSNRCPPPQS